MKRLLHRLPKKRPGNLPAFLLFLGAMWVIRNLVVDAPVAAAPSAGKGAVP